MPKHVHLIGICGSAMASLAGMLQTKGYRVTGSDAAAYPPMLLTESLNDSQVAYWEAAKFVAKVRVLNTDNNQILLKMKMDPAGHGGASGRYDQLHDRAFECAWLLGQVGITK